MKRTADSVTLLNVSRLDISGVLEVHQLRSREALMQSFDQWIRDHEDAARRGILVTWDRVFNQDILELQESLTIRPL